MVVEVKAPVGTSLQSLVRGFVLTKKTEGKSQATVDYYQGNLRRFVWYTNQQNWPDDIRLLNEWHIREFLGYVSGETYRWGLQGNGSETSRHKASHATTRHYYVVLSCFFAWLTAEGFLKENPMTKIRVGKSKRPIIQPYTNDEIKSMLRLCDYDYDHGAKFLASRNKAIILTLLDSGVRLGELVGMKINDLNKDTGCIKVIGKGNKERIVRVGKVTQKAIWKYLLYCPSNGRQELWVTQSGKPVTNNAVKCLIRRIRQRANVDSPGNVHKFRHSFSMSFLRVDRNPFNLQILLGHSTLDMTRHYVDALGMEDALKAHEKASPVDQMGIG